MATYFHGSNEIQPQSIQTLYLMNPNFSSYSNTPYPQAQHLVGIPIQTNNGLSLSLPVSEIANRVFVPNEEVNISGLQSVLRDSKYLKFAQQLLDEIVNVGKGMKDGSMKSNIRGGNHVDREDEIGQGSVEVTISERQELQMKKAKLVNMLDEVIQRYKQYRQQMQVVVSSFEAEAGSGSAKSYTSLALQTISKHFRSLQDAITGRIRAIAKRLGEEEFVGGTNSKGSRLQFVDQQVRQQRALQQLGMIHQVAWRPQRGLPERSVSVLRAWLFEHFLHPYPKDSDKKILAKQTGLTRSQVSNWFINARVRLWKPMVEEMYKEEMKGEEHVDVDETTSGANANEDSSLKSNAHQDSNPQSPIIKIPPPSMNAHNQDDNLFIQSELKKTLSEESMNAENGNNGYNEGGGLEEYSNMREIERFGLEQFAPRFPGNNISLTLGLTHYNGLSLSEAQPAYLSHNSIPFGTTIEMSSENNAFSNLHNNLSVAYSSNSYENISIDSRKRFASQLLRDFVA